MSYQVLARKWRPQTFADVVGQQHVLAALENGLRENRLHHAYLFSGTRGVGKTSIARLFAKGLNCVHGITAEPCGECENCKAIEAGNFIDLIEIDAASRTKVEDTRELLDNVQYKPVVGRYKVYLIDEVHMLSRHSFNALLKTLEEPPEYVKFLLATTDPQKLPVTILSRCMQFHLKALDDKQISAHLHKILTAEQIPFVDAALDKLAKAAQGSVRDSLSLTDQAIAMGNGKIELETVNTMLGLLDENQPLEIIYALHQGNGERLMKTIQTVADKAGDWDELLTETAEKLHQIALLQLLRNASQDENDHLAFLAKHMAPEDVQFFYQVIVSGRQELNAAPNRRIGAEMTLLRALAFHPKFLTAAPKANPQRVQPISTPPDNSAEAIEMRVLSQNIKATYSSQQTQKTARSVPPPQALSATSTSSGNLDLPAFAALQALNHLSAMEQAERQEQKAVEAQALQQSRQQLEALEVAQQQKSSGLTELPIIKMTPPKKRPQATVRVQAEVPESFSRLQNTMEDNQDMAEEEQEIEQQECLDAETYRWEWSNPELAKFDSGVRPSEIKQAILQGITPELRDKIIAITQVQDPWTDWVERCGISGFSKELALNCFLLSQDENTLNLGLHSDKVHLRQTRNIEALAGALSRFLEKPLQLNVQLDDSDVRTPMDYRQATYRELSDKAREALQQDKKILLLQKEFAAVLDVESIRPV